MLILGSVQGARNSPSLCVCKELMQGLEFSKVYGPTVVFIMYPAGCRILNEIKLSLKAILIQVAGPQADPEIT